VLVGFPRTAAFDVPIGLLGRSRCDAFGSLTDVNRADPPRQALLLPFWVRRGRASGPILLGWLLLLSDRLVLCGRPKALLIVGCLWPRAP
jgi:hypothetical protein